MFCYFYLKQKELIPVKSNNLLPTANLLLSNIRDSKKMLVRKNNELELEFYNNDTSQESFDCLSYLDFILDPLINYEVQVKLE